MLFQNLLTEELNVQSLGYFQWMDTAKMCDLVIETVYTYNYCNVYNTIHKL